MKKKVKGIYLQTILALALSTEGYSQEIILENSVGENYVVEIEPTESFLDVVESINHSLVSIEMPSTYSKNEGIHSFRLDFMVSEGGVLIKAVKTISPRNYLVPATPDQKIDITEIVKTLANSSLVKIKNSESSLKKAGDRIDDIHPFQFLITIFTDEELKVYIRNLQGRSWVWKRFLEGITETLAEEHGLGNLLPFAQDFANRINMNINVILPLLETAKWEKFVNTLIDSIPRQGGTDRYDM